MWTRPDRRACSCRCGCTETYQPRDANDGTRRCYACRARKTARCRRPYTGSAMRRPSRLTDGTEEHDLAPEVIDRILAAARARRRYAANQARRERAS